ncbi:hypothetical protein SFR_0026 [Streptomyces sp. FR-008]|nr:hypothetical protein SFR_0026 [Streptomyces sp. FR-008]
MGRGQPVDSLANDPLRAVRRPLPLPGARVEWHIRDRCPPFVLVPDRREDAVKR